LFVGRTNFFNADDDSNMSASLMLRSDSFNARVRGTSHIDFKTATTGVAAKAMRNEISQLVATVQDPAAKKVCTDQRHRHIARSYFFHGKVFDTEMQSFFFLFTRYLAERAKAQDL
jgi:UTP--glucose-1-phosphate uridylyltransferase